MKINKKFALQLPKQDFYHFKLCTVDEVHVVRHVDNNNIMPFPSHMFNSLNVWLAAKTHPLSNADKDLQKPFLSDPRVDWPYK